MLSRRFFYPAVKRANLQLSMQRFATKPDTNAKTTSLYDLHVERGGKMVNFGGFLLPVQYNDLSIVNSHLHTRSHVSLFDVSHMLQTEISGKGCMEYLETICTADVHGLQENVSALTVFTSESGGILDDLIVTKITDDHLFVVSNAGRKEHDQQHMLQSLETFKKKRGRDNVRIRFFEPSERALIALQGPKAAERLQLMTGVDLSKLYFMQSAPGSVAGVHACRITRCGYTGEDGFEISVPAFKSIDLVSELIKDPTIKLAGLGARDSLRLEAGLCLYGNDIDEGTTPVDAALTWLVAKKRRERGDFPGARVVLEQIAKGSRVKRVGLIATESGPPARHGAIVYDADGTTELGKVTSGCPAPSLDNRNIAMAYVPVDHSKIGTTVAVKVRDKMYEARVTKMPFVPSHYYTKPKAN